MGVKAKDWADFWNQPHSIYVNRRHLDVHYRDIAEHVRQLLPAGKPRVLDYGCGEAIHAGLVADSAAELVLCDAAPGVRDRLVQRFAGNTKIRVLAPDEVDRLPAQSFDFMFVNSVVQYVPPAQVGRLLGAWRRLLAPDGAIIIADIIPPHVGPLRDAVALARYAAKNQFLLAAMVGCVRTFFSAYRRARSDFGVATYTESEFLQRLATNGLVGVRLPFNLEHNPARMTFRVRLGRLPGEGTEALGTKLPSDGE
ncbi:MAG: class I SAM-dependent methyltransferase [Xanthobacteraceae bacterium]|nr:class I SAM-dependent methyltransferase [Xanthobacteraceae bacterium]